MLTQPSEAVAIRFLLVEDDENHALLVRRGLEASNVCYHLDHVKNGEEALAFLHRSSYGEQGQIPDVILLDIKLPRMNGHQVLEILKRDEELRCIPVVMLTTSADETDRLRAYKNHVNSYLVKPVDFGQFRQMMKDVAQYWGVWNQKIYDEEL